MKVRKAVIPVAGFGTRFLPITKTIPKEMLPILNKPILQYIIEEAVNSGIEDILLVTNSYKKSIEDYFDISFELEKTLEFKGKYRDLEKIKNIGKSVNIYYIRQGEALGTGHAIYLAKKFVGNEPFAVMYGDDMFLGDKPTLKELIEKYEETNASILAAMEVDYNQVNKYGVIVTDETGLIKQIVEKPQIENAPSNIISLGRYIFKPEIFNYIDLEKRSGNEIYITDAIEKMMKEDKVYIKKIDAEYHSTGDILGYLKANISLALKDHQLKEEIEKYLKEKLD